MIMPLDRDEPGKQSLVKVALDTSFAGVNPTGVGIYSRRLASALTQQSSRLGLKVEGYGPTFALEQHGWHLPVISQEWPTYTQLALPFRLLLNKPNITHATSHIGPLWGPGKLIVTVHDLIFRRYPEDYDPIWLWITNLILPMVLRRATAVISDSHTTKTDIQEFYGARPGKVVTIYPGVDKHESLARRIERDPTSGKYILCLGPWVRRKNLEVVIKAFAEVGRQFPDVRLVVTGKPSAGMKGYTREELLTYVPETLHSRLVFAGYVAHAELSDLIAGASVLAYPSRWEGFGLPPLEAMAAGVPVVVSSTPTVKEVTGGAAMLCDPDDTSQWSEALGRVLTDERSRQELIHKGKARSAQFSWERCAEQTAALYHRVARAG